MPKKDPWLPHRLDAMLHVRRNQARLEDAITATLKVWLPQVEEAVVGHWESLQADGPPPDPQRAALADAALQAQIASTVAPVIDDMLGERFAAIARGAQISDVAWRDAFVDSVCQRIGGVSNLVREEIQQLVFEAVNSGLDMEAAARGIRAACTVNGPPPRMTMFKAAEENIAKVYAQKIRDLNAVAPEARGTIWEEQLKAARALHQRARNAAQTAAKAAKVPPLSDARRIARTEIMAVLNGGTTRAMQVRAAASGDPMEKMWLATADGRCRPTHKRADGQRVPVDGRFQVGSAMLDHPGDPHGEPGEVINCRCTILEVLPGEDPRNPLSNRTVAAPASDGTQASAATVNPQRQPIVGATMTRRRLSITEFTAPAAAPPAPAAPPATPGAPAAVTQNADGTWPFTAVLAVEGRPTGDGRQFDAGALVWRELPLPLLFQPQTGDWGHTGSYSVGRIDTITRDGDLIRGTGVILPANPNDPDDPIQTLLTLLQNGVRVGPSVDLDDMVVEWPEIDLDEIMLAAGDEPVDDDLMRVTTARVIAATVVATPAFAEVALALGTDPVAPSLAVDPSAGPAALPTDGGVTGPAGDTPTDTAGQAAIGDPPAPAADPAAPADDAAPTSIDRSDGVTLNVGDPVLAVVDDRPRSGHVAAVNVDASTVDVTLLDGTAVLALPVDEVFLDDDGAAAPAPPAAAPPAVAASAMPRFRRAALTAAAGPAAPPSAWFDNPQFGASSADDPRLAEVMELNEAGEQVGTGRYGAPLFIADDGRLFGHIATWGTCHTGFADVCVTPPRSATDYAHFRLGEVVTAEGTRISVGRMTVGGGHADARAGFRAAVEHYDNAGTVGALVACGEDEHGIWVAGAMSASLTEQQEQAFRACPPSGDWRRIGGNLELMGVLAVNVPGFPIPRPRLAAVGGVQASLVAAGVLDRRRMVFANGDRAATFTQADFQREFAATMRRKRAADDLARKLGRDVQSRLSALRASVHGDRAREVAQLVASVHG